MAKLEAIVLAGGLGTRLRSVVPDLPKVLAPVAGQPFLAYVCRYLAREGVQTVALALGYRADLVKAWLGDQHWGFQLRVFEEEQPLGTGGAIGQAIAGLSAAHVIVLNGDTYVDVPLTDFMAYHEAHGEPVTIAAVHVQPADRYGTLVLEEDRVMAFAEKAARPAGWINAGVYAIRRDWWMAQPFPATFSWESHLQAAVMTQPPLQVRAYKLYDSPFIDIGVPLDYERAQCYLPTHFR